MAAIELRGVTKRYEKAGLLGGRSVTALHDLDLTVRTGEIFGFLGPNGAGKSTTIDILLDYTAPTEGSVHVLGRDVATDGTAVRDRVGILPDGYGPIGERTGREHVAFAIEAKDADDDPDDLIERVGMAGSDAYPVEQYSKGMAQRLMLAMALVGEPDLLILDEPSTGLDPNGARTMRRIVREENARGATVFFSSHILEQVEAVCDRVAIVDGGELVAVDTIDALRESNGATSTVTVELSAIPDGTLERVRAIDGVTDVATDGTAVVVTCENAAKAAAVAAFYDAGADVTNVTTSETSLEELFESYTRGVAQ
ncbi:ABC transporter ATP-binding protein [Natrialbaceae archaeon AArc-T1-2]|uniref:ABC transporter ATP-binding protein n=1 Tax=Natrialbaceae archaeon AArc-T1-2 TaxID=3053904 RepID=UPI00255B2123|nr:ABC transporter ATP-binding protein [Natrialbaceae archaeon AArc-T1-2]WIV65657.1 ABC transporter ATP-binding protein [Natrialbaceae archaeon AArc-T1-2]